jgi:PKD repeat protein
MRPPRGAGALVACLAALACTAPGASALVIHTAHGRFLGITLKRGTHLAALAGRAAATTGAGPTNLDGGQQSQLLLYHGGPVVRSHATYAIFWDPNNLFTNASKTLIAAYLADVAHDSGGDQNVYGVTTQYGDGSGPGVYSSTFGGSLVDSTAYPPDFLHGNFRSGCVHGQATPPDPTYTWCLTDAQIQTELNTVIRAHSWPTELTAIYFVFLPAGIDECMGPGLESSSNQCADTDFCGYHASFGSTTGPLYAVQPYADISGCQSGNEPNADPADDTLSIVSHEHNETVTDPFGTSWYDVNGNEVADKCAAPGVYGTPLGGSSGAEPPSTPYLPGNAWNQVIDRHDYFLQDEFSNVGATCLQRPAGQPPDAVFSAPTTIPDDAPVTFDASGSHDTNQGGTITSYSWDFGDGSGDSGVTVSHAYTSPGTYSVTLTVTNSLGYSALVTHTILVKQSPVASFTLPGGPVPAGQPVAFDGSASSDVSGSIVAWSWSFGDGTFGSGPQVSHTYTTAGTYTVSLTVTDGDGGVGRTSAPLQITAPATVVQPPPKPPITPGQSPPAARIATVGAPTALLLRGGLLVLTGRELSCPEGSAGCSATVTATILSGRHWVTIGAAKVRASAGHTAVLSVHLNQRGLRLLRKLRRLRVHVRIAVAGRATTTLAFTLRAPRALAR